MYKLANQVLDVYDDLNFEMLKKIANVDGKLYVRTADERAELQDTDFALSIITKRASKLNKYPLATKDDAWLSNEYFDMTHQRLPKLAAETAAYNIKLACEEHGIKTTPAVEGLAKSASSNVYVEDDTTKMNPVRLNKHVDLTKFAEVEKIAENYTHAQYAMGTPTEVKIASYYFDEYNLKFPLGLRHKYAESIQRRARELGMSEIKGQVQKYACEKYGSGVEGHLRKRASLLEIADPKFSSALTKLATMRTTMDASQFAKVLHGFDKRAGLTKYYGGYLKDPYEATFGGQMVKKAQYGGITEDEITEALITKYAKVKEYFGHSIADELKKHGMSIFESLPKDSKEIIVGIANGTI